MLKNPISGNAPGLIRLEDEVSRLQSALTLVQMACEGLRIGKDTSDALHLGIDHAMQNAIQVKAQLTALRTGTAALEEGRTHD